MKKGLYVVKGSRKIYLDMIVGFAFKVQGYHEGASYKEMKKFEIIHLDQNYKNNKTDNLCFKEKENIELSPKIEILESN